MIQGRTLSWVVRRLGVTEEAVALPEPETAQAEVATAALDAVRQHLDEEAATELVQECEVRAERARIEGQDPETKSGRLERQQRL